jgi:phenylacetate-coenzyme A ligase PaaK-like adenylate-forming protein
MKELEDLIFTANETNFEQIALKVFDFQYDNSEVYKTFVDSLNRKSPKKLEEIPFLPISFFKTHDVICGENKNGITFLSSGTTQTQRSKHLLLDTDLYIKSFTKTYVDFAGELEEQVILALLPNYLEQGNSSLVFMVDHLIQQTKSNLSGFFKNDFEKLIQNYEKALSENKKVVIFGVSYALLDLAELKPDLSQATIIETGGMKGRRKEIQKEELHAILCKAFQVDFISSEYGMTELLSQAYSNKNGFFHLPNWMKILIRDTNDPFEFVQNGKTGGINIIDLANLYSCSFIATQDLGQSTEFGIKLMGRFDNADIRGCNLMME